jgi:hypothetical protein
LGFFVVMLAFAIGLSTFEVSSQYFDSRSDALSSGAIGEGKWLPSFIPRSATAIREAHDVDSNEVWFSFDYKEDFDPLKHSCVSVGRESMKMRAPKKWDRFPQFVKSARHEVLEARMKLFACRGESYQFFLSINTTDGRAFGWSK